MNPFDLIESKKDSFTKKEMLVYEILQNNPDVILHGNMSSLSRDYGVSQSTITRFCQKLGYDGFNAFKFDVFRYEKQASDAQNPSQNALDGYIKMIELMKDTLDEEKLDALADQICAADCIYIFGCHKSSLPARMLTYNLTKLHKHCILVLQDAVQDIKMAITRKDLLIIFSMQGHGISSVSNFRNTKAEIGFPLAVITGAPALPIQKYADLYIPLPLASSLPLDVYLENQLVPLIYTDLLTSRVAQKL